MVLECILHSVGKTSTETVKLFDDEMCQKVMNIKNIRLSKVNAHRSKYYTMCMHLPSENQILHLAIILTVIKGLHQLQMKNKRHVLTLLVRHFRDPILPQSLSHHQGFLTRLAYFVIRLERELNAMKKNFPCVNVPVLKMQSKARLQN